tara:strand:- start:2056 stop:2346 length:291 start_codon:yes stop_codon:yes gene_type:complete
MWDDVKPITLVLEQTNQDESIFVLYFYTYDSEYIKLKEAFHFDKNRNPIGSYSRLLDVNEKCKYELNFFMSKLTKTTIKKMIEYFENPKLYIEFMI